MERLCKYLKTDDPQLAKSAIAFIVDQVSDLVRREGVGAVFEWKFLNNVTGTVRYEFPLIEWHSVHTTCYMALVLRYRRFMRGDVPQIVEKNL